jgi:hypothetical protein
MNEQADLPRREAWEIERLNHIFGEIERTCPHYGGGPDEESAEMPCPPYSRADSVTSSRLQA